MARFGLEPRTHTGGTVSKCGKTKNKELASLNIRENGIRLVDV